MSSVIRKHIKRGNLAPLLSEEQKQTANIQALSYDFACRITRLFQYLTEDTEYKEYIISKQIFRSGTSVGANRWNSESRDKACLGYAES